LRTKDGKDEWKKNKRGKYEARNGREMTEEAVGKLEEKHWRSCKGSGEGTRNRIGKNKGKAGSTTRWIHDKRLEKVDGMDHKERRTTEARNKQAWHGCRLGRKVN